MVAHVSYRRISWSALWRRVVSGRSHGGLSVGDLAICPVLWAFSLETTWPLV